MDEEEITKVTEEGDKANHKKKKRHVPQTIEEEEGSFTTRMAVCFGRR